MAAKLLLKLLIPLILLALLASCAGGQTRVPFVETSASFTATASRPAPTPTAEYTPTAMPAWRWVEAALSMKLLGTPDGKCEWDVWGWLKQEVYVWAPCQSAPKSDARAASVPAVLEIGKEESIQAVNLPEDGTAYSVSVRRLFPPAVQERVFAHDFDISAAEEHLAARWKNPALAPAIYAQTGDPLPQRGEETVPAISAEFVGRISAVATLGGGNVERLAFLPDGQLVAYGKRGIEVVDKITNQVSQPFQTTLSGAAGSLSADGSLLAIWTEGRVQVVRVQDGRILQSVATDLPGGKVAGAYFLPDRKTLAVEVRPPGGEIYSDQVELYRLSDGTLLKAWDMQGTSMLFSPDGQAMVSRYAMSGLKFWSIPGGVLLRTLKAVVGAADFSPDGRLLAVSDMGVVHVYRVVDGQEVFHLSADIGPVSGIAFSSDGKGLLTWSDESFPARLWRLADQSQVVEFPVQGVMAGAFSRDGTSVALAGNGAIGLYFIATGKLASSVDNQFPAVADLSFAPDVSRGESARLAVLYGINTDHTLLANWDVPLGTRRFLSDAYSAISLEYTRDPYGIALGAWQGKVLMINPDDGTLLRTFEGLYAQVQDLAQSPRGELAASSMYEVQIFALSDANEHTGRKVPISGGWVGGLSWTCNLVSTSMDGTVGVLDATGESVLRTLTTVDHGGESQTAVPLDCSQILAGQNQFIYRWQTSNWKALPTWSMPAAVTALAVSPDGSLVAVGLADGQVQLLERESGKLLRSLSRHVGGVTALEFSFDGRYLATGGADGVVLIWGIK